MKMGGGDVLRRIQGNGMLKLEMVMNKMCCTHVQIFKELIINSKNRMKIKTGKYINRISHGEEVGKAKSRKNSKCGIFTVLFSLGVTDSIPFLCVTMCTWGKLI